MLLVWISGGSPRGACYEVIAMPSTSKPPNAKGKTCVFGGFDRCVPQRCDLDDVFVGSQFTRIPVGAIMGLTSLHTPLVWDGSCEGGKLFEWSFPVIFGQCGRDGLIRGGAHDI